jgi:hypothetical protein
LPGKFDFGTGSVLENLGVRSDSAGSTTALEEFDLCFSKDSMLADLCFSKQALLTSFRITCG